MTDSTIFLNGLITIFSGLGGMLLIIGAFAGWGLLALIVGVALVFFSLRAWFRAFSGNDPFWGQRN